MNGLRAVSLTAALALATPARAHHGVAAVGAAGSEGLEALRAALTLGWSTRL